MAPRHRSERRPRTPLAATTGRRRSSLLAIVALVAAGLIAAPQIATAAEPQILRTVDVSVAKDGSITAVRSTVISDDGSGEVTTDAEDIAPVDADLPVRVQTTYRTADSSGADLEQLEGYSGPLTIDVTVQNTTVRPQLLSYNSGGRGISEYALVGSPLTVVGAVTLGDGTRVITSAEGTNGVLSQREGGQAVQWSAILAPPQLAATATFRLVLDVDDFEVPRFDLSVQPGLVTDPSVAGLLNSSFAAAPNSSRTMQLATLATIAGVNGALDQVGTSLEEIRAALAQSATSFGGNARTGLASANVALQQRLDLAVADLSDASVEVDSTIETARANGVTSLDASLREIQEVLGTAGPLGASAPPRSGAACATNGDLATSETLLGLLSSISSSLNAYSASTTTCRNQIVAALSSALGSEDERADPAVCEANTSQSAVCQVGRARQGVSAAAGVLRGLAAEVGTADAEAETALDAVEGTFTALGASVVGVRETLGALASQTTDDGSAAGDALAAVATQLGSVRSDLVALQALTAATGDLAVGLETVAATAQDQLELIDTSSGLRSDLVGLLDLVCGPAADDASPDLLALLADVVGLGVCPEGAEDIGAQLDSVAEAWSEVAAVVGDGEDGLTSRLATINGSVTDLLADVDAAQVALDQATTAQVTDVFTALAGELTQLSDTVSAVIGEPVAPGTTPTDCAPATQGTSFVSLDLAWAAAGCRLDQVDGAFTAYVGQVRSTVDSTAGSLDSTAFSLLGSRNRATESVEIQLNALIGGLRSTAGNTLATGTEQIDQIDEQAEAASGAAGGALTSDLRSASQLLQRNLGVTQTNLAGTRQDLAAALTLVLEALGAPTAADGSGGAGIIGSLGRNSAAAGTSLAVVTEAAGDTAAFQSRRVVDLGALDRAQEQFRQASIRESEVTTAGVDASASSVVTVFTFHVGGE